MINVVLIFGYNNTRLYDIERLKNLSFKILNAEIVLCKEKISKQDIEISPYTIEINLEPHDINMIKCQTETIDQYLQSNNLNPVACLPFSDKGVPLGSYFARHKGLAHDSFEQAEGCIDKYTFRCLEAKEPTPTWYKKPFFCKIYTYEEAVTLVNKKNIPLFFKPTSEGNSRGCIEINSVNDLKNNKAILDLYFEQGIIVEQCIKGFDEYSFDGVAGNYVITEKKTSQGYYRVETQHILPAPLDTEHYNRLIEAGKIVAKITGSNNGAVHHELFLNKKTGEVYCVEPNRRPAGLKLWDWVNLAYPEVDNWNNWIAWASSTRLNQPISKDNTYFVGCRMLQSPKCGIINKIYPELNNTLIKSDDVVEIVVAKPIGSPVTAKLKDNSDFLGYVVCKSTSINGLLSSLDKVANQALSSIEIL